MNDSKLILSSLEDCLELVRRFFPEKLPGSILTPVFDYLDSESDIQTWVDEYLKCHLASFEAHIGKKVFKLDDEDGMYRRAGIPLDKLADVPRFLALEQLAYSLNYEAWDKYDQWEKAIPDLEIYKRFLC